MLGWDKLKRLFILGSLSAALPPVDAGAVDQPSPVVVELFTSQGCGTCPSADLFLSELAARPGVIALGFHVDYWNYIGWSDPFGSKMATDRQREYEKYLGLRYVYTPQMVINGAAEGVGSERATILRLIDEAAADGRPRIGVYIVRHPGGQLVAHLESGPAGEPATAWLVRFDREHVTQVPFGENEGLTLRDIHVVRTLKRLARWNGAAMDLDITAEANAGDGGLSVLVQLNNTGRIIGAGSIKASDEQIAH
jgi:hypothetical protein